MAFKLLSEEQIALLTENQKQQYEKELDIYRERSAFVERMHILENVELSPYEPRLQSITVISGAPETAFRRQEYTARIETPAAKPEHQFHTPEFGEPVSAVLPECFKAEGLKQMPHIPAACAPDMPDITALNFPHPTFATPQKAEPLLPEVAVGIAEVKAFCKIELSQVELPTAVKPGISVDIKKTEEVQAVLPELVNIKLVNAEFKKTEVARPELPFVSKPIPVSAEAGKVEIARPELPSVSRPVPVSAEAGKVEIAKSELPPVSKPMPVSAEPKKVEIPRPELPVVSIAEPINAAFNAAFRRTETVSPRLPRVSRPGAAVRKIEPIERASARVPAARKINVVDKKIKPVERAELQIPFAPAAIVEVKPFAGVESKAEGLPEKAPLHVPNAYEALRELLPHRKNPDIMEEVGS